MRRMPDMDDTARTQAYASLRREYNDLRVVAGAGVEPSGFTLLAILRDEMYFLPAFLAHYRRLGIQRFVFLNDRSDDGSHEYLLRQPDTVVVQSERGYGDTVELPRSFPDRLIDFGIQYLWRAMLHDMFAHDRWAVQVDMDEFIRLPRGMTFQDIAAQLGRQGARAAWGVMLDVYPRDIATFAEREQSDRLDMSATWYFDGEQHLRLRKDRQPGTVHPGARARLYREYGIKWSSPAAGSRLGRRMYGLVWKAWQRRRPYNALQKPVLLKWEDNCYFRNSHYANLPASSRHLLPIQHFRFAGSLHRKIRTGLREKSYFLGSIDHRHLRELLHTMEERNGSFVYRKSRPVETFEDFVRTRNAFGL